MAMRQPRYSKGEFARRGNKPEARAILEDVCIADPFDEKAWLWRASLAESRRASIDARS